MITFKFNELTPLLLKINTSNNTAQCYKFLRNTGQRILFLSVSEILKHEFNKD